MNSKITGNNINIKDDKVLQDQTNQPDANGKTSQPNTNNKTNNTDTGILDAVKGSGYSEYKPNSQNLTNTGTGATSASGTDYSWNQKGTQAATKQYEQDLLTQDQNYLQNRSTIENNAVNYQAQSDMMKYQNNQTAEKVGWTGGYILDQNRQSEYLKQTIQAQMYGAMELQKYGYDSALSAARLSYDLNQQEFAHKYYQEAQAAALSEAQLTGVYFSAEVKDMMAQLGVARQKLIENPNDENAKNLETQINNWFSENKISPEGVKTLEAWQAEQATELQWSNELWTRYNATMEKLESDFATNPSKFIKLDENGNEIFDGLNIETGNWDAMSGAEILNYITTTDAQGNTVLNGYASNQFYSYLDSSIVGQAESGFTKWCESKNLITTDKDGNKQYHFSDQDKSVADYLIDYIVESDIIDRFTTMFKGEDANIVDKLLGNWDFTIQLPDGQMFTSTYRDLMKLSQQEQQSKKEETKITFTDADGEKQEATVATYENKYAGPAGLDYYSVSTGNYNAVLTTAIYENGKIYLTADKEKADKSNSRYETYEYDDQERNNIIKTLIPLFEDLTKESLDPNRLFVINDMVFSYNKRTNKLYRHTNDSTCGTYRFDEELKRTGQWAY